MHLTCPHFRSQPTLLRLHRSLPMRAPLGTMGQHLLTRKSLSNHRPPVAHLHPNRLGFCDHALAVPKTLPLPLFQMLAMLPLLPSHLSLLHHELALKQLPPAAAVWALSWQDPCPATIPPMPETLLLLPLPTLTLKPPPPPIRASLVGVPAQKLLPPALTSIQPRSPAHLHQSIPPKLWSPHTHLRMPLDP